jgi:large subunit ribosomal protein L31
MKAGIHPKWYPEARVTCASCGKTWTVGAAVPEIRTDVCSNCHPFYTGQQRIVDTEGQVDRFIKRLEKRQETVVTPDKKEARRKQKRAIVELVDEEPAATGGAAKQ